MQLQCINCHLSWAKCVVVSHLWKIGYCSIWIGAWLLHQYCRQADVYSLICQKLMMKNELYTKKHIQISTVCSQSVHYDSWLCSQIQDDCIPSPRYAANTCVTVQCRLFCHIFHIAMFHITELPLRMGLTVLCKCEYLMSPRSVYEPQP